MLGAGARLASMALSRGKLIVKLNIFGITASMKDRKRSKIVQLLMDFIKSECTFSQLLNVHDIVESLNMILLKLGSLWIQINYVYCDARLLMYTGDAILIN